MKTRGLATILIITILTSSAGIFLAAFAYNYYTSRQAVLTEVAHDARDLTRATAYKIAVVLKGVEKVPLNLAAVMDNFTFQRPELLRLIKSTVATNPEVYGVAVAFEKYAFNPKQEYFCPYYFRQDGVISYDPTSEGDSHYQYWYWDWYQIPQELNRPMWSEPYYDEGSGNIIMCTYSVPFFRNIRGKKTFLGIVAADVSLMWLKDIVGGVKVCQTGYAFLISPNGVFVTYPDERLIMRSSIFSIAEARQDPRLRQIGRDMIKGSENLAPIRDFLSDRPAWMYYAPVPGTGWSLGVVYPEAELYAPVLALHRQILIIGALGLGFLGLVITVISRRITAPLRSLARQTAAIATGDFAATAPEAGSREIAHLAHSFNEMGRQLTDYIAKRDFIRDTFGRYVTQEVVKRLLEDRDALELGGETRELSILMSDLRGFTALTADMHPEQVITFLNRYLGKMIEILVDHRATIDEIIGDGILAFFGAPEPMEDHPRQAVACALAMQTAMEEINRQNDLDGLPYLQMGIAVNTGLVVVGNIGSEQRAKYSVVGSTVNFTGRMESYSVGGQVLISESVYERVREVVELQGSMQVQMKGVPLPATLYDVRGLKGEHAIRLKERCDVLILLATPINVKISRIKDKIIRDTTGRAFITHLCDTAAKVTLEGDLQPWDDVRLNLLDENLETIPGKIYGKVIALEPRGAGLEEADIRFTSVSQDVYRLIRQVEKKT
ncbi:MAG: adenylate/guanylate cyclase domain-containing protein [Desulfobaccales bacterium]